MSRRAPWLQPGRTIALLGSSGVGKSTLINRLMGDQVQVTLSALDADAALLGAAGLVLSETFRLAV